MANAYIFARLEVDESYISRVEYDIVQRACYQHAKYYHKKFQCRRQYEMSPRGRKECTGIKITRIW